MEQQFDARTARRDLKRYRRKGPNRTTQMLLNELGGAGAGYDTLLDIGGGIGALQHELIRSGIRSAVSVDASRAYLDASREEASERGYGERVRYIHGDLVDVADQVPSASIVTLDRVVCCYHDVDALLNRAAARTGALCGLVYPRDAWWTRVIGAGINAVSRLRRSAFRFYLHPADSVDAALRDNGLALRSRRTTPLWQVVIYERQAPAAPI